MVSEISEGLVTPDLSLLEVGGQHVLVCINRVIPDKQGHGEQHGSVQILPVGGRPPQHREQGEVTLLEFLASLSIGNTAGARKMC